MFRDANVDEPPSQLSEMSTSVMSASNSAIASMARNVKT